MTQACRREAELLDALGRGFVAPELERHVVECPSCAELHLVAGALLDDRGRAVEEAPVPSAGTMWWRMRIRQRHEAQARARRSLLVGQAVTLAIALTLLLAVFGPEIVHGLRDLAATVRFNTPLLLAFTGWTLLAPLAGWIALRQK